MSTTWVIGKRQLMSLLANPLGYVFMLVFVFGVNATCFFPKAFYIRNIADLGLLESSMPWYLALLVSAISMNAWTQEREHGTEELLLTLPVRLRDAVLGKFLAIVVFFSLALLAAMSSVCVLMYLGDPDLGLIAANFMGWWFQGIGLAALALCVSVSVSSQTQSFVVALLVSVAALMLGQQWQWGAGFNRGMFALSDISISCAFMVCGLSIALMILSSRRWRPEERSERWWQIIALIAAIICTINVTRIAQRLHWQVDMTEAGLSSLSEEGHEVVQDIDDIMVLHLVLSEYIPDELSVRSRELLDMALALSQSMGDNLQLEIIRPRDPLTETGRNVQEQFKVEPRQVSTDTVAGRQSIDVFLGAHLRCGKARRSIPFFTNGMSIEYELVRAIRGLSREIHEQQYVVGVVSTEIEMLEHFSKLHDNMLPEWKFISELRQQYDVREVIPDLPYHEDLDAVIVPMPSGLTQDQLTHLEDYLAQGGKALLLEDPMPILLMNDYQRFGVAIAPSLPRYDRYAQVGEESSEKKCDINSFYKKLGIELPIDQIAWSIYKPDASLPSSHYEMVWLRNDIKSFANVDMLTGVETMLFGYPGMIRIIEGSSMMVAPLVNLGEGVVWGENSFDTYLPKVDGRYQFNNDPSYVQSPKPAPDLAVSIRGQLENERVESDAMCRVIVVADLDIAHDHFFRMASNLNVASSPDFQKIWASVRNVQFLANALDDLLGDVALRPLRQRHVRYRSLQVMDDIRTEIRNKKAQIMQSLKDAHEKDKTTKLDEYKAAERELLESKELDRTSKLNQQALMSKERDRYIKKLNQRYDQKLVKALSDEDVEGRRYMKAAQRTVSYLAITVPSIFFIILALWVSLLKYMRERKDIPAQRLRSQG
jgi:ABC-2 type transport system permease protein